MASPKVPEGCPLTPRRLEVLQLLASGKLRHEVAAHLSLDPATVRVHARRAARQLGARTIPQATALLASNGWLHWDAPATPALREYSASFDQWVTSGFTDQKARDAMHRAAGQAQGAAGSARGVQQLHPDHEPMRALLHHVAIDTLTPTPRRA